MSKVLLVEDSKTVNALISKMLSSSGFEVRSAYTVEEAMSLMRQERFDLVITDLIMPGIDGVAFIEHIRDHLDDHTPGIVAISGGSADTVDGDTALDCVKYKADRLLKKPFSKDDLLGALTGLVAPCPA